MLKIFKGIVGLLCFAQIATGNPEASIKVVMGHLKELESRLDSIKVSNKHTHETIKNTASDYLQEAKTLFIQNEFTAVVVTLKHYLRIVQSNSSQDHLFSQYLLGESYQNLGQTDLAIRHYLRYLAAFLNSPSKEGSKLIPVIQNLLLMMDKYSRSDRVRVAEMMSSLASLQLPEDEKSRVLFYLALSAENVKGKYFANRLFQESSQISIDPRLKAENFFYSAMIAFRENDMETAAKRFQAVVNLGRSRDTPFRHYSQLNLGRISAIKGHYSNALSYWRLVSSESRAYEESLYESIVVHQKLNQPIEAIQLSKEYLNKFPDHKNSNNVRHMQGLLYLKAGMVDDSNSSIETQLAKLKTYEEWLKRNYFGAEQLSLADVQRIITRGEFITNPPRALKKSAELFERINSLTLKLNDIRSEIRSTIFLLGSITDEDMNPSWVYRSNQIKKLFIKNVDIANILLDGEYNFYKARFTPELNQQLIRSRERREKLNKKLDSYGNKPKDWQNWIIIQNMINKLDNRLASLHEIDATLASMMLIDPRSENLDIMINMQQRSRSSQRAIIRSFEILRAKTLQDITNHSEHLAVKSLILEQSQVLYEEALTLEKVRDHYQKPHEHHMALDLNQAWAKWEFITKSLYNEILRLDETINQELSTMLADLDQKTKTYQSLLMKISKLRERIQTVLGSNSYNLLALYIDGIQRKRSQLMKWRADNQLAAYNIKTIEKQSKIDRTKVKGVNIEEDLTDLEYEVN